jgi:ABC-2 type transport system permease protein
MSIRIPALVIKEFRHILRDWQTLGIVLGMPVFMMFLYGYALNVNINDVEVMVEDPLPSYESRQIVAAIDNSSLFKVVGVVTCAENPSELFKQHHVKALFRFPTDFSNHLRKPNSPASIQILIDGSDQNLGTVIRNVAEPFLQKCVFNLLHTPMPSQLTVHQTILYNPQQKSALFFVPGLMAIILMMVSAMLTSLAITREKENGTLDQMLVSPIKPQEIMIGKLLPYMLIAMVDALLILVVGRFVFNVHIQGNIALLTLATCIYIFCALALGLLISTIAKKQVHAMMIVLPITMLPTVLLSGFIFPIASLPLFLQWISHIIPATYFLVIIRAIILKGVGISALWQPMLILFCMGFFLMIVSTKKFQVKS